MISVDKYEFTGIEYKNSGYHTLTFRIGCIEIATVFSPDKRKKRDYYIVRLYLNQERGKIDFTKDKHFDTLQECTEYIHRELKKTIKYLNEYCKTKKFKMTQYGIN